MFAILSTRSRRSVPTGILVALLVSACADGPRITTPPDPPEAALATGASNARTVVTHYDSRTLAEYTEKWGTPYGRLALDAGGTLTVSRRGEVTVGSTPFAIGADYSVYDHLKYIAISNQAFDVPENGSLTFSVEVEAATPGAVKEGRVIQGCYGPPGSYPSVGSPCAQPWSGTALEGMQAGVVLNMINFATGQLFDWFVSGNQVFALVERLPSNVTNPAAGPGDPGYVGLDKAYTQIIRVADVTPGQKHSLAIRYSRVLGTSTVEYFLDGVRFASVSDVGVPLDVQGEPFTGFHPSYGPGEPLRDELDSFVIGHGLFSLLDAFPYQHPERPDLSVSIPMSERLFGQGAVGSWAKFKVVQMTSGS